MKDDKYLLNSEDILGDVRQRAAKNKEEVFNNPNSTDADKKKASDILEFVCVEDCFTSVPRSTIFGIFSYLGFKSPELKIALYSMMYDKIIEEINKKYILIDKSQIVR